MKKYLIAMLLFGLPLAFVSTPASAESLSASQIKSAISGKTCRTANGNLITFGSTYTVRDHKGPTFSGTWRIVDGGIIVNFTKASGAKPSWRPRTKNFGISRSGGTLYIGTVSMTC